MINFGKKLREVRTDNKITLDQLAEDLGVSKVTICRYEYNKSEPKLSYLQDIANYFGTSVDYFLEDREEYKINLFVRLLAKKLQELGFDFEAMNTVQKEALADLLLLSIKHVIEYKEVILKIEEKKSTD